MISIGAVKRRFRRTYTPQTAFAWTSKVNSDGLSSEPAIETGSTKVQCAAAAATERRATTITCRRVIIGF